MRSWTLFALLLSFTIPAFADDQQKAIDQLNHMNGMAYYATLRSMVNLTMADQLKVKRASLVDERREYGLTYGDLWLAHQLIARGAKMDDLAEQLKAGKTMVQIAGDQHIDWKQVNSDSKKLNAKIEDNLYSHMIGDKPSLAHEKAENYVVANDYFAMDQKANKKDTAAAEDLFNHWIDVASKRAGVQLETLNHADETLLRGIGDPVVNQSPSSSTSGTGHVPH